MNSDTLLELQAMLERVELRMTKQCCGPEGCGIPSNVHYPARWCVASACMAWRFTADKSAAAIMGLHAADPARQMADAEAALWREHDARHNAAELSSLRADLADAVGVLEPFALRCADAVYTDDSDTSGLTVRVAHLRAASALLSRLKNAKP